MTHIVSGQETESRPNPQKRNILIRKIARAPWWLLAAILIFFVIYSDINQDPTYQIIWKAVQEGIELTIKVTVYAYAVAIVLGFFIALLRQSRNFFIYQIATFYVEIVRGVPTLVLVFYVSLALTPKAVEWSNELGLWMIENGINLNLTFSVQNMLRDVRTRDIDNVYRAGIALAVSYSAFLSEIFRAGIESVDKGQVEAAKSLGLSGWKVTLLIVLPQAIRNILPPLSNDFIAMLKESSLVSMVGVQDITLRGRTYASSTFTFFESYNIITLTYLVMTLSLAMVVRFIEDYFNRGKKR